MWQARNDRTPVSVTLKRKRSVGRRKANHHIKKKSRPVSPCSTRLCCWLLAGAQRNSLVASVNITFRITEPEPPCVDLTHFLGPCCIACSSNGQNKRPSCLPWPKWGEIIINLEEQAICKLSVKPLFWPLGKPEKANISSKEAAQSGPKEDMGCRSWCGMMRDVEMKYLLQ